MRLKNYGIKMVDVYLNEKFIGTTDNPEEFIKNARERRRLSKIPFNTSVYYDTDFNQIYLDSTRGRTMRLVVRVENGKPLLTKEHADKIIVLSEGRVQEEGTHAELIEKKGLYWHLQNINS